MPTISLLRLATKARLVNRSARALTGIVVGALIVPQLLYAGSLSVSPTTIELPAEGGTAALYVVNHGNQAVMTQVEGFDWRQVDGKDKLIPSQDLQVSPPIARVVPGGQQTIRLQVSPSTDPAERTFRLLVSELPDSQAVTPRSIHVLLQFSVPVFVGDTSLAPDSLVWDATLHGEGLLLTARNQGLTRAKLTNLHLITTDGHRYAAVSDGLSYVLGGATRNWTINAPGVVAGEKLRIEGYNERGGTKVTASVVVHQ